MPFYAWGSNGAGQLGVGHAQDLWAPSACIGPGRDCETDAAIQQEAVVGFAAGGVFTVILLASGTLVAAGDLSCLGRPPTLHFDTLAQHVRLCAATWEACTLCLDDGSVQTIGKGAKGELGRGSDVVQASLVPEMKMHLPAAMTGRRITAVASGLQHTVALLDNGEAWGWGNGRKGQLGLPEAIVWTPRKIEGLKFAVSKVACGRDFTVLMSGDSQPQLAILGNDRWSVRSSMPASMPTSPCRLGASWGSTFTLSESGEVLSWGRDDHGQLAPKGLPPISQIAVGSEHVLALTTDGNVLAWGWGEHGNCGQPVDEAGDVKRRWNIVRQTISPGGEGRPRGLMAGCATSWIWS